MPLHNVLKALYEYAANEKDELSFAEDELLCILSDAEIQAILAESEQPEKDNDWIYARPLRDQEKCGLIPINYVEPIEPIGIVRAEYEYSAQEENEVSFAEDEQLQLLSELDSDWWLVKNNLGQFGLIPSNYVQIIKEEYEEFQVPDAASIGIADPESLKPATPELHTVVAPESIDTVRSIANSNLDEAKSPTTTTSDCETTHKTFEPAWIDTVQIRKQWSATLTNYLGNRLLPGFLIVTTENVLAFINQQNDVFRYSLADIISYDRDAQLLTVRLVDEPIGLKLNASQQGQLELQDIIQQSGPMTVAPVNIVDGTILRQPPTLPERPSNSSTKAISPVSTLSAAISPIAASSVVTSPVLSLASDAPIVVAIFDYIPQADDELKIAADEQLALVDDTSLDWWMVQRLHGSHRRGLVPKSYLKFADSPGRSVTQSPIGSQDATKYNSQHITQDPSDNTDADRDQDKSPLRQPSRPATPKLAFLDELKIRAQKSPVAVSINTMELNEKAEFERRKEICQEPICQEAPQQSIAIVEPNCGNRALSDKSSTIPTELYRSGSVPKDPNAQVNVSKDPALPNLTKPPIQNTERPNTNPIANLKSNTEPSTKLKASNAASGLAAVLLKKKQDIDANKICPPTLPTKPLGTTNRDRSPNPWSSISLKKTTKPTIAASDSNNNNNNSQGNDYGEQSTKGLPSRPEKAQSNTKPRPANTRLWTDRSEKFQIEAEYLGLVKNRPGMCQLHKLNGQKVIVPIDRLSERDCEFIRRKEGLSKSLYSNDQTLVNHPNETTDHQLTTYGGIDWLSFFVNLAGLDPPISLRYAKRMVIEQRGEGNIAELNRDWFIKKAFVVTEDLDNIVKGLARQKALINEREATRRNLELIGLCAKKVAENDSKASLEALTKIESNNATPNEKPVFSDLRWSKSFESNPPTTLSHNLAGSTSASSLSGPKKVGIKDYPVLAPMNSTNRTLPAPNTNSIGGYGIGTTSPFASNLTGTMNTGMMNGGMMNQPLVPPFQSHRMSTGNINLFNPSMPAFSRLPNQQTIPTPSSQNLPTAFNQRHASEPFINMPPSVSSSMAPPMSSFTTPAPSPYQYFNLPPNVADNVAGGNSRNGSIAANQSFIGNSPLIGSSHLPNDMRYNAQMPPNSLQPGMVQSMTMTTKYMYSQDQPSKHVYSQDQPSKYMYPPKPVGNYPVPTFPYSGPSYLAPNLPLQMTNDPTSAYYSTPQPSLPAQVATQDPPPAKHDNVEDKYAIFRQVDPHEPSIIR